MIKPGEVEDQFVRNQVLKKDSATTERKRIETDRTEVTIHRREIPVCELLKLFQLNSVNGRLARLYSNYNNNLEN